MIIVSGGRSTDILVHLIDAQKGFPEVILVVYPETEIQLCTVQMMCSSLKYIPHWTLLIKNWGKALGYLCLQHPAPGEFLKE